MTKGMQARLLWSQSFQGQLQTVIQNVGFTEIIATSSRVAGGLAKRRETLCGPNGTDVPRWHTMIGLSDTQLPHVTQDK
jgi:hypothetical protein